MLGKLFSSGGMAIAKFTCGNHLSCALRLLGSTPVRFVSGLRHQSSLSPVNSSISTQTFLSPPCTPLIQKQPVRTNVRKHYRPNPAKRIKKHGIHVRMQTEGGLAVLWRRFLKGRHNLAVYEDFRPLLKQFQKPPRKVKW